MANGYLGVGNIARKLKSMYIGVDGTARKVKKAYVGVNGMARLWYQAGTPLGELAVGNLVRMKVNGTSRYFIVVHQGKPSSWYDDSCDGTWLLMNEIYTTSKWSSFSLSSLKPLLDSDIQSVVKSARILKGGEVGFSDIDIYDVLSYFSGASDSKRIAYYNGKATNWWLDSTFYDEESSSNGYQYYVTTIGGNNTASKSAYTSNYGIRPAFILPSTVLVDDSNNVIA